jgi:hypothetical protein
MRRARSGDDGMGRAYSLVYYVIKTGIRLEKEVFGAVGSSVYAGHVRRLELPYYTVYTCTEHLRPNYGSPCKKRIW